MDVHSFAEHQFKIARANLQGICDTIAVAPKAGLLITACAALNNICVFSLTTNAPVFSLGGNGTGPGEFCYTKNNRIGYALCVSPDESTLFVADTRFRRVQELWLRPAATPRDSWLRDFRATNMFPESIDVNTTYVVVGSRDSVFVFSRSGSVHSCFSISLVRHKYGLTSVKFMGSGLVLVDPWDDLLEFKDLHGRSVDTWSTQYEGDLGGFSVREPEAMVASVLGAGLLCLNQEGDMAVVRDGRMAWVECCSFGAITNVAVLPDYGFVVVSVEDPYKALSGQDVRCQVVHCLVFRHLWLSLVIVACDRV